MPERLNRWLIFAGVAVVPLLLVVAPIGTFLAISIFRAEKHIMNYTPTAENYAEFFGNWTYFGTYLGTILLCLEVMALSILVGYPIAWFIWRQKGSRRYVLLLLAVVPLFMSYIVKLYTLRSMLGLNGLISQMLLGLGILEKPSQIFLFNQRAVLITMAVIYMPFVILPIFLALERIPRSLQQA
jgi:spermidine/putrescine transport system permease protein